MTFLRWFKKFFSSDNLPFDIDKVESALHYHFNDPSFLFRSLKHRSYSQAIDGDITLSNERFEFLGDSVLNMVVSHHLFSEHSDYQEGDLTKLRSNFVNKKSAMIAAKKIGLDRFILLNESEENAGGRNRTSIVADTFEAVIGAIFLDGGYEAAKNFIQRTILRESELLPDVEQENYKSQLLELVQAEKIGHPIYRTVSEKGPDHNKIFTVEVRVNGKSLGTGKGKSKKDAQQLSAKEAIARMETQLHNK